MSLVTHRKEVASLPSKLEPDTIYYVRTGNGFDLYVSDATGAAAHKINTPEPSSTSSGQSPGINLVDASNLAIETGEITLQENGYPYSDWIEFTNKFTEMPFIQVLANNKQPLQTKMATFSFHVDPSLTKFKVRTNAQLPDHNKFIYVAIGKVNKVDTPSKGNGVTKEEMQELLKGLNLSGGSADTEPDYQAALEKAATDFYYYTSKDLKLFYEAVNDPVTLDNLFEAYELNSESSLLTKLFRNKYRITELLWNGLFILRLSHTSILLDKILIQTLHTTKTTDDPNNMLPIDLYNDDGKVDIWVKELFAVGEKASANDLFPAYSYLANTALGYYIIVCTRKMYLDKSLELPKSLSWSISKILPAFYSGLTINTIKNHITASTVAPVSTDMISLVSKNYISLPMGSDATINNSDWSTVLTKIGKTHGLNVSTLNSILYNRIYPGPLPKIQQSSESTDTWVDLFHKISVDDWKQLLFTAPGMLTQTVIGSVFGLGQCSSLWSSFESDTSLRDQKTVPLFLKDLTVAHAEPGYLISLNTINLLKNTDSLLSKLKVGLHILSNSPLYASRVDYFNSLTTPEFVLNLMDTKLARNIVREIVSNTPTIMVDQILTRAVNNYTWRIFYLLPWLVHIDLVKDAGLAKKLRENEYGKRVLKFIEDNGEDAIYSDRWLNNYPELASFPSDLKALVNAKRSDVHMTTKTSLELGYSTRLTADSYALYSKVFENIVQDNSYTKTELLALPRKRISSSNITPELYYLGVISASQVDLDFDLVEMAKNKSLQYSSATKLKQYSQLTKVVYDYVKAHPEKFEQVNFSYQDSVSNLNNQKTTNPAIICFFALGSYGNASNRGAWLKAKTSASDNSTPNVNATNLPNNVIYQTVDNMNILAANLDSAVSNINAFWFSEWQVGEYNDGSASIIVFKVKD